MNSDLSQTHNPLKLLTVADVAGSLTRQRFPVVLAAYRTRDLAEHPRVAKVSMLAKSGREAFCHVHATNFLVERANLRTGVHILRHTFCSRLVMLGAPMPAVQALVGHQDLTMTQRYSHLSPNALSSAIRLLERVAT